MQAHLKRKDVIVTAQQPVGPMCAPPVRRKGTVRRMPIGRDAARATTTLSMAMLMSVGQTRLEQVPVYCGRIPHSPVFWLLQLAPDHAHD